MMHEIIVGKIVQNLVKNTRENSNHKSYFEEKENV